MIPFTVAKWRVSSKQRVVSRNVFFLFSCFSSFSVLTSDPYHKFRLPIATEGFEESDAEEGLKCYLVFTYSEKYPDTAPIVEIEDPENFSGNCESQLLAHIDTVIADNLGIEMIFPVVSSAQEWLNVKWDKHQEEEQEQKELEKQAEELKEQKRFEGTRVTVETFLKWKTDFDTEFGHTDVKKEVEGRKLTGKELFLTDASLNDSDIKFLLSAGDSIENVKIDESLFQNLDDLELGSDDDSGDDDWVPGKDD